MLPFTVNSPRAYRGKSKSRFNATRWAILTLLLICGGAGALWYLKARTAQLSTLVAVITEHENKFNHLTAEIDKKDNEIRRLNRALEAGKNERTQIEEDITVRNARIEEAETNWRISAEELAALKKLHDGVHGQLREALDRNSLQEQETIEARSEVAKCYQLLNSTKQSPAREGIAETTEGVIAAGARKAGNATSNVLAEVASVVNRTAGNLTSMVQSVAQSTDADDETTYPGLEQLILPQQELR